MSATCGTCRANQGLLAAPGGVIHEDALWRVEHAIEPIPIAGWLIAKPLRHVEAFADLTPEEAAAFGPLVRRVMRAMSEVLAPAKIYLCLFAELENFAHIHFHLIPRWPNDPPAQRGPGVFDLLRRAGTEGRSLADVDEAARRAARIREAMVVDR